VPAVGVEAQNPTPSPADAPPGTQPLTLTGDIASQLVEGVDRFCAANWSSRAIRN
jgi:hypothetical protein